MLTLTRHDSWDAIDQVHRQLNRLFDGNAATASRAAAADWIPPVDVAEYTDRFDLKFDVPGVNLEAIEITLDQGVLTIAGTREQATKQAGAERGRTERPTGRFQRSFTLPDTVDSGNVAATARNGVLEVTIPKQPKAQPRRIEVAAA